MNLTTALLSSNYNSVLLFFSLALCIAGAVFSVQLIGKLNQSVGKARTIRLIWGSLVFGITLWAAGVFAAAAPIPTSQTGFQSTTLFASLFFAVAGTYASFWLSQFINNRLMLAISGTVFGMVNAVTFLAVAVSFKVAGMQAGTASAGGGPLVLGALFGAALFPLALNLASRNRVALAASFFSVPAIAALLVAPVTASPEIPYWFPPGMNLLPVSQTLVIAVLLPVLCAVFAASGDALDHHYKHQSRRAYRHLALQDPLTHLPTRRYVENIAERLLKDAEQNEKMCAVVLVSLDQFKAVNELHGYATGDAVLKQMSILFRAQFSEPVVISRFYGDEFLIINPSANTLDEATHLARQVRDLARRPIQTETYRLSVQCSIGVAVSPRDGQNLAQLVQRANLAAKQAKSIGGNSIQPYVTGMEENNRWEAALAADLRYATLDNQLNLLFQRQNETKTGQLIGYEALVRWRHAEKGQIPPEDFIPIAERSGIILDIGAWVLREACRAAADWRDPVSVSVNASPSQFTRSDFSGLVSTVLLETGLKAERLEIELTESTPIEDHERVLQTIVSLQEMGVRVAMDDYGTGYSSLNTLQAFPFDKLKVDRVFTQSLEQSPQARAILRSAILLGHSFGIPVIAEGVETEKQLDFLKEMGCQEVQGFFFGKHLLPSQIKSGREDENRQVG
ncbi:EAL domain-containing protein [Roseibium sp.]|uniref:EAL domain-containing protein n=1 Tax=Roseibium sp. TaxID=1936156 RepID=UPI003D0B3775